jgi:type III secretion protein J
MGNRGMRRGRQLAFVGLLLLGACKTEIYTGLPEQEANDIVSILLQNRISSAKLQAKDGSDTVMVEQSQFAQAVTLLKDQGYPRKKFESMGDVFQQSSLVASPMQERARFLWALSQELSGTVSEIDGVLTARVQVVLPDNDLLQRNPTPSSASVFIRYDAQSQTASLVPQIKILVANSVEGLSYDRVSVVLVPVARRPTPAAIDAEMPDLLPEVLGGGALALIGLAVWFNRRRLSFQLDRVLGRLPQAAE